MKHVFTRVLTVFAFLFLITSLAAAAPKLEPKNQGDWKTELRAGEPQTFEFTYTGDPPTALTMVVLTPNSETVRVPAKASAGDPATGVTVTWPYTPTESGTYHYHFEASAGDLGSTQYPAQGEEEFVVVSMTTKWLIFLVGTLIALLFLPFVVYIAARALNKNGNPASAARVALMIGLLASYLLFLYPFWPVYGPVGAAAGAIVALGLLIVLFTRK